MQYEGQYSYEYFCIHEGIDSTMYTIPWNRFFKVFDAPITNCNIYLLYFNNEQLKIFIKQIQRGTSFLCVGGNRTQINRNKFVYKFDFKRNYTWPLTTTLLRFD
uniref:Uncharacterized protein n=1 Tax=Cacopsylla melanoneura TaxID=428564 RepID=A0A8D9B486_9HEMI